MLIQTLKMTGIASILMVGVVGSVVLAQQGKGGSREPAPGAVVASPQKNAGATSRTRENPDTAQKREEKTRQIEMALDKPITMSFANETPLDDVLKYIKQATTTPTFPGIPIYVEPLGLEEAGKTIHSTIRFDRENVPLREMLRLILQQVGQAYLVKDGFLLIDSRMSIMERRVEDLDRKLDKVLESLERLQGTK